MGRLDLHKIEDIFPLISQILNLQGMIARAEYFGLEELLVELSLRLLNSGESLFCR